MDWEYMSAKGFPKGIQKDEQKYPRNMVFQCKGIVGHYNRVLKKMNTARIQHTCTLEYAVPAQA